MRVVFAIFLLFIFSSSSSAFELGISPEKLFIEGETNQNICGIFHIFISNYSDNLTAQTLWNINRSQVIQEYVFHPSELGLSVLHLSFLVPTDQDLSVCIRAKCAGSYYGALMIRPERYNVGIGGWIELNVTGKKCTDYYDPMPVTGFAIVKNQNVHNSRLIFLLIIESTFLFLLVVSLLFLESVLKRVLLT